MELYNPPRKETVYFPLFFLRRTKTYRLVRIGKNYPGELR